MQKAKTFDIEDSNIALLGSQADKDARKKASEGEPAWQISKAQEGDNPLTAGKVGEAIGIFIWRIEKFKVVEWPREEFGTFHSGDSYILLYTQQVINPEDGKPKEKLQHDIHFWIGKESSQDEYGTAAYKTVELDDYINYHTGSDPVQHREIEGSESSAFLALFPKGIVFAKGGVETGFRHVEPTQYEPRLLHIKGKKNCVVREVPVTTKSMNKGDCFILDHGLELFLWIGSKAGLMEKAKAAELINTLESDRMGKAASHTYDEKTDLPSKKFWDYLGGKAEIAKEIPDEPPSTMKRLFRVSDADGSLKMTPVKVANIASLDTNDAFILDLGKEVFVWIGAGASENEKARGLEFATNYLKDNKRPKRLPITVLKEGAMNQTFNDALAGGVTSTGTVRG